MVGTSIKGLFLAVLAMAAGELQETDSILVDSDVGTQGCDAEELQGLDLLQMEVRLQSDPPHAVPVASHSAAEPVEPVSLVEMTGVVNGRSIHHTERLIAFLVSGGVGSKLFLITVVFTIIVLCGYLLYPRGQDDFKRIPAPRPAARQLLEAPRSTTAAQSPITASYNPQLPTTAAGSVGPTMLPPICPSLILPHTEARFMIPIESLMRASGELDIKGTSGRKLLHGAVTDSNDGRRCLALASCGCDEDPRVTLLAPHGESSARGISGGAVSGKIGIMELYGKGGKFYGTLEPGYHGGAVLRFQDELVMSLEIGSSDLRMTASSMDGRLLASAGQNVTQGNQRRMESNDTWKLQVQPNYDAVLISACMLGVLLFSQ